jgi:hypothetical protein
MYEAGDGTRQRPGEHLIGCGQLSVGQTADERGIPDSQLADKLINWRRTDGDLDTKLEAYVTGLRDGEHARISRLSHISSGWTGRDIFDIRYSIIR